MACAGCCTTICAGSNHSQLGPPHLHVLYCVPDHIRCTFAHLISRMHQRQAPGPACLHAAQLPGSGYSACAAFLPAGVTIVVAFVLASFIRSGSGTCDQIDPAFDNASNQFSNTASIVLACLGGLALLGTLVGFALWVVYVRVRSWREMAVVMRPKEEQDDEASV